jgi:hypothetical protein
MAIGASGPVAVAQLFGLGSRPLNVPETLSADRSLGWILISE